MVQVDWLIVADSWLFDPCLVIGVEKDYSILAIHFSNWSKGLIWRFLWNLIGIS